MNPKPTIPKPVILSPVPYHSYELFQQMMIFIQAVIDAASACYRTTARQALNPHEGRSTVHGLVLVTRDGLPEQIITPWGRTSFVAISPRSGDQPAQEFIDEIAQQHDLIKLDPMIAIDLSLDPNEGEEAFLYMATSQDIGKNHKKIVLQGEQRPLLQDLHRSWQKHMDKWNERMQEEMSHEYRQRELTATAA